MREATLVYCLKGHSILLGMKKRGFGAGKLNGYGGKVNPSEDVLSSAARELSEEACLIANTSDLEKVAEIDFYFVDNPEWDQRVHVFLLRKWTGTPHETEEMRPEWHDINSLPFERTWADDPYWLPSVLSGKKVKARFTFKEDSILKDDVRYIEGF